MKFHSIAIFASGVSLLVAGVLGAAPLPLDGQFEVNTFTTQGQYLPKVAYAGDGSFLVLWQSERSPTERGRALRGQWLDPLGERSGDEFAIHRPRPGVPSALAEPATLSSGDVVAAWLYRQRSATGFDSAIEARILSPSGDSSREFEVRSTGPGDARQPKVDAGVDGTFIVTWIEAGVTAQRFWDDGQPLGLSFELDSAPDAAPPSHHDVAVLPDGRLAMFWLHPSGGQTHLWARLFTDDGVPLGPFRQLAVVDSRDPAALQTVLAGDEIHVTWSTFRLAFGSVVSIFVQSFDAGDLTPLYPTLAIRNGSLFAGPAALGAGDDGTVVLAWVDDS
ncbi:MAG: hypothetical protein AAFY88_14045, partial [Acidobacteriota bacterium]